MFLTGEFSRIARVSKRLLQYYDEIDLLNPEYTDARTGYRYYSAKQLPRLNRILAMKDLGLSLEQIRRLLADDVSADEVYGMLLMQKAELEKKLLDDMQRFRRIESRLQTYMTDAPQLPDVVMRSVPEVEILSVNRLLNTPEDGWTFLYQLFQNLPKHVDMNKLGHMILTVSVDEFVRENTQIEFGFMVTGTIPEVVTLNDTTVLRTRRLPAIQTMATIAHVGHPETANIPYGELGTWIEVNGYQMNGYQREVFIEFSMSGDPADTVMELQIPVKKVDTDRLFPLSKID